MYALNLADDGRILSATYPEYAPNDAVTVEALPSGDLANYRYIDGVLSYEPLSESDEPNENLPTVQDDIDAMLVDHEYRLTLLELGLCE